MRTLRSALVLALLVGAVALAPVALAQDPIEILEIDTYDRRVAPSTTVSFNWTVWNPGPVDYDIAIAADPVPGWTIVVTPTAIAALAPNRAGSVRVDVTAPAEIDAETTLALKVFFTASQGGAVVFIASRTATVTIPSVFAEKKVLGVFANPLPAPLDNEWGVFLLNVVLWGIIAVVVMSVVFPLVRRTVSRTKTEIDNIVVRIVRTPIVVLLFLYGTLQSLEALERHIAASIRGTLFSIYQVALAIIILYIAYKLFKNVLVYLGRTVAKKTASNVDDVIVPVIEKVGVVVIAFAGLGLLLGYLNVDLTVFIAGGVVISMVLAFAAQDTISNFFSGLFLLTDRPFKEGDIIILSDGDWVEVRRIGMRTTRLFRFSDASMVTVPNNRLVDEKIANFSNPKDRGRHTFTFNVAYGSDPATVKKIIQEALAATPHIVKDDPNLQPILRFDAMGESSLDFFVLVWIDDRKNRFTVRDVLNTEVYMRLRAAGIDIPFPQRTVHLRMEGASEAKGVPADVDRFVRRVEARGNPGEGTTEQGDEEG